MWIETFFSLSNGTKFSVVHNVEKINSIDAAFQCWTKKFTQKSFIDYINSKGLHKVITKEQYEKLYKR